MPDLLQQNIAVVSMTVTNLHSLGATGSWQSDVVDNGTNDYLDALVQIVLAMGAGTSGSDKGLVVYAYASIDGGTTYPEAVTGTQGTLTLATDRQLRQIGFIPATVTSATIKMNPFSVAAAFGGILPERWGIVIENRSGIAIAAAGSTVKYQPYHGRST